METRLLGGVVAMGFVLLLGGGLILQTSKATVNWDWEAERVFAAAAGETFSDSITGLTKWYTCTGWTETLNLTVPTTNSTHVEKFRGTYSAVMTTGRLVQRDNTVTEQQWQCASGTTSPILLEGCTVFLTPSNINCGFNCDSGHHAEVSLFGMSAKVSSSGCGSGAQSCTVGSLVPGSCSYDSGIFTADDGDYICNFAPVLADAVGLVVIGECDDTP